MHCTDAAVVGAPQIIIGKIRKAATSIGEAADACCTALRWGRRCGLPSAQMARRQSCTCMHACTGAQSIRSVADKVLKQCAQCHSSGKPYMRTHASANHLSAIRRGQLATANNMRPPEHPLKEGGAVSKQRCTRHRCRGARQPHQRPQAGAERSTCWARPHNHALNASTHVSSPACTCAPHCVANNQDYHHTNMHAGCGTKGGPQSLWQRIGR